MRPAKPSSSLPKGKELSGTASVFVVSTFIAADFVDPVTVEDRCDEW